VTIEPEIIEIGKPKPVTRQAVKYQSVRKHGRTTGHTIGVVMGFSEDVWVRYGTNNRALFDNQIAVIDVGYTPFAQAGDSGSLIVDAVDLAPMALLFATGNRLTFANPIDQVLQYFNVTLA